MIKTSENTLVTPTRVLASEEAHKCYDTLCGARKTKSEERYKGRKKMFADTVQAFYAAAVVGHVLQRGERHVVKGKTREVLLLQQWERREKEDLRKALTFLAKIEYKAVSEDDVLQVVAELADRGIKHIWGKFNVAGDFDYSNTLDQVRKKTGNTSLQGPSA